MKTNLERIRQMTTEELAYHISGCVCCIYYLENCRGKSCIEGHKQWLEQESEE